MTWIDCLALLHVYAVFGCIMAIIYAVLAWPRRR